MVQGLPIQAKYQHHWHLYISKCSAIIVLKFIIMFSYFIYIVLKLKNKYSFFFLFFFFIFNLLCRRTIRQYVEQVLRLCTVLVFPPPLDFVHIYTVNKGNNKITELRTILQRESPNS